MTYIATRRAIQTRAWSPHDINESLSAWYDGYDSNAVSLSGSSLVQWNDKSGLGNHLVTASTGTSPAFVVGLGAQFTSNSYYCYTANNANLPIGSSPRSMYIVYLIYSGRPTEDEFILQWGNTSNWCVNFFTNGSPGNDPKVILGTTTYTASLAVSANVFHSVSTITDGNILTVNINGTNCISASGVSMNTPAAQLFMGRNYDGTRPFNGIVSEAIILNCAASVAMTNIIEGYLAWRWGLQSFLPSAHPYKTSRPRAMA